MGVHSMDAWKRRDEEKNERAWTALGLMLQRGYALSDTLDSIEEVMGTAARMFCERRAESILRREGQ